MRASRDGCGPGRRRRRRRRVHTRLHRMIFFRFGFSIVITLFIVGALVGRQRFIDNKWLTIAVAALALWGAAGAIAHRLVRPISRVAAVAREIGDGDLSSRVTLGHRAPGEIRDLGHAINEMAERIEKQLADQRALLAAVSHEIRTPLGHMRVIAELARSGDKERLAELEDEIALVDGLVDKLLASSRLEFDTLSLRALDSTLVCLSALERADLDAGLLEVETDAPTFVGDAMLVSRAIGNLLENAIKHADEVTSVRLSGTEDLIRIAVADRGPGFPSELVAGPFDDFHPGGDADGSPGLGLALVSRIAAAHDGQLIAENTADGAVVTLELARSD